MSANFQSSPWSNSDNWVCPEWLICKAYISGYCILWYSSVFQSGLIGQLTSTEQPSPVSDLGNAELWLTCGLAASKADQESEENRSPRHHHHGGGTVVTSLGLWAPLLGESNFYSYSDKESWELYIIQSQFIKVVNYKLEALLSA